ncbi:acyltransferase [Bradyrhizobium sp. JR18.2]|uniref:acyltransferase family protein n=1 Tax=Bradyrhizobium sp. JR18.2 TaxID=3156369 RepID=UPI00339A34AB
MKKLNGVQAARGVAALAVVVGHVVINRPVGLGRPTAEAVQMILQVGVDLFFVISGFIITITAAQIGATEGRLGAINFSIRRFARIYPLYWVVLACAAIVSHWVPTGPTNYSSELGAAHILLATTSNYFVPVAWTLSYEVLFYVIAAAALIAAPKHAVAIALFAVLAAAPFSSPLLLEFAYGIALAVVYQSGYRQYAKAALLAGAAFFLFGVFVVCTQTLTNLLRVASFGPASALALYFILCAEAKGATFPRAVTYLGDISYSMYIWHLLVLTVLRPAGPKAPAAYQAYARAVSIVPGLEVAMMFVAILVVSVISYELFERSIMKVTKRALAGG